MHMPETTAILLVPNAPGFELKKIRYYADPPYKGIFDAIQFKSLPVPTLTPWVDPAHPEGKRADQAPSPEAPTALAEFVNSSPAPAPAPPAENAAESASSPEPATPAPTKPTRKKKLVAAPPVSGENDYSITALSLASQQATEDLIEAHPQTVAWGKKITGKLKVLGHEEPASEQ
jgi:hypothetical protein